MNEDTFYALRFALDSSLEPDTPFTTISLVGEPAKTKAVVRDLFQEIDPHVSVVEIETSTIPSQEELQNYRRHNASAESGNLQVPNIVEAFLKLTGIVEMPEVLIFDNWNRAGHEQIQFTKVFLDPGKRPMYETALKPLKIAIVLMDTPGSEGTVEIDRSLRDCFQNVMDCSDVQGS